MKLSLKSKFKSAEIVDKRRQMIENEHLHIKQTIPKSKFKSLYQKYGSSLSEKDFAWAFLDMDEIKYTNLENEKTTESTILSYEYVSDEEFETIRKQVTEKYNLKDQERRPIEEILEMYEHFGGKLHVDMFFEEILGIKSDTLKRFRKANSTLKNGKINFEAKPGKYNEFHNKPLRKDEIPMYVLNPAYILDIRQKIIYESGLHIGESINYKRFCELYNEYGKDMTETLFAEAVLDIGIRSLNRMKTPKEYSTTIFDDVEIPEQYILALREKITILNKLEGRSTIRIFKITRIQSKIWSRILRKRFCC